ncbi:MAG: Glu-tRNA(Gln) amidotransferase subunit GatD, partial [Candidatus Woesearchaeota archaeon]
MHPGDKVKIRTADEEVEGILMESSDENIVSLKLSSGYNIGIAKVKTKEIKIIEKFRKPKEAAGKELPFDPNKPTISILHTGGTIASKVDYRTGAVVSKFSPEDLLESFPELKDIANIKTKLVFQMFSEDMEPEHWTILAEEVKKVAEEHVDGIIITHGTDTMSYSSSALSFALQNLGIPVILVGAQRSSDRPSTDASDNLYAAAKFIAETDYSGVGVCMHETTNDNSCLIHRGVKVRKMHSSRRDAFK